MKNSSWYNIWDDVFKFGAPPDLLNPYPKFNLVIDKLVNVNADRVLDVAVGAGRHAVILASTGMKVFGFDLSKKALELTRGEAKRRKLTIQVKYGDMFSRYDYQDNYFDAVVAIQAIYHGYKENMEKALTEIHRVLRPSGVFCFTVSTDKKRSAMGSELKKKLKKIDEQTYVPIVGREKGVPHFYPQVGELYQMLGKLFREIDIITDEDNRYLLIFCKNKTKK